MFANKVLSTADCHQTKKIKSFIFISLHVWHMTILKDMESKTRKHHKISDSDITFFHSITIRYQIFRENFSSKLYGRNSPIPAHLSSRCCCTGDAWASVYSRLSMPSTITLVARRVPNYHSWTNSFALSAWGNTPDRGARNPHDFLLPFYGTRVVARFSSFDCLRLTKILAKTDYIATIYTHLLDYAKSILNRSASIRDWHWRWLIHSRAIESTRICSF